MLVGCVVHGLTRLKHSPTRLNYLMEADWLAMGATSECLRGTIARTAPRMLRSLRPRRRQGMPKYKVRDADSYGHAVGILMLDYRGPFIPGDVGNATTYDYPVLFKVVKGLTLDRVLAADKEAEADIIEAAQELERF